MIFPGALDGFCPTHRTTLFPINHEYVKAIYRMREVIRRQYKALSTEECFFYRDILGQPYVAACGPPRSLAVVPLIGDKRYYGEAPGRLRGGSGGAADGCAPSES